MSDRFRVQQIDHVELFVPDRYEAAKWCGRVFGLEIMHDYEDWATDGGPLMVSSDDGGTMLALFEGEPQGTRKAAGFRRVAFRVAGPDFLRFLDRLPELGLLAGDGNRVSRDLVEDHGRAHSIYLCDPYGNPFEITTYDYDYVSERF